MKKSTLLSLLVVSSVFADAKLDLLQKQLNKQQMQIYALETKNTNQSASFSQNAYLPAIALILNMSAVARDVNNTAYEDLSIPGFIDYNPTNKNSKAELPFNKSRGFNLNYAEVAMHSAVDPYFDAFAIFHLHPHEFEIEEAYVQTRSLPYALRIKAGKFKSNFGRMNFKHQHSWHFDAQPIIYKALFGPDAISDAGIQLQWIAPTDTYIMTGIEALQGTNERSFGDKEINNLYVSYLKSSIDIGEDLSILGGISLAHGKNLTTHTTDVYGVDLTMREQLGAYSSLIWQSEYLQRNKKIDETTNKQGGFYTELIYRINRNYYCGVHYDAITKNDIDLQRYSTNHINTDNLNRYLVKIDYKPFSMSRLRLSYSYDRTKVIAGERKNINTVMLSLNIAAGAHGAHNY